MKKLLALLTLVFVLLSLNLAIAQSNTNTVTLAWDTNCNAEITGYNVYWGFAIPPGQTNVQNAYVDDCGRSRPTVTNVYYNYTWKTNIVGRTNTSAKIFGLEAGKRYSFAATSYIASGLESDFSNPVEYLVPTNAPPTVWTNVPTAVQNFRVMQAK